MKRSIFIVIAALFVVSACTPATNETTQPGDYIPGPADSNLTRVEVSPASVDLLTMESFPLQFSLHLTGYLPTPCHKLRVAANPPDSENKINVDVYALVDPEAICAQTVEEFDINFPLGSFPTGHYFLFVNGIQITEFDA